MHEIYNKKVVCALFRLNTFFYKGGEKTGKILARQVKQKDFSNTISAIKQGDTLVTSVEEINKVFQKFYEKLYASTASCGNDQKEQEVFFSNTDMPKLLSDQAEKLECLITEVEIRTAVSLLKSGKSPG